MSIIRSALSTRSFNPRRGTKLGDTIMLLDFAWYEIKEMYSDAKELGKLVTDNDAGRVTHAKRVSMTME
jgi:hypothetical protein